MTDYTTAAIIVNYNMPERADSLAEALKHNVKWPLDVYLVDNGSDICRPALHSNVWVKPNQQTTGGWLEGLKAANAQRKYFAYWFLITSAEFVDDADNLTPCMEILAGDPNAVAVHPALTEDSTTLWTHMITFGGSGPRRVHYIDNIASIYRADWFDSIGWFDPGLTMAHGICLETSWKARQAGRSIWIQEAAHIKKVTDIGYTQNRMNMTAERRREIAREEMDRILGARYGMNYWNRLLWEGWSDQG